MKNISFNDGYESFTINNDPDRVIRFNPKDVGILERFDKVRRELKEETANTEILLGSDGKPIDAKSMSIEDASEVISRLNQTIMSKVDYIFSSPVSHTVFGVQSPLAIVGNNGDFLYEAFLAAAFEIVKERIEESAAELDEKVERYTGKYKKE